MFRTVWMRHCVINMFLDIRNYSSEGGGIRGALAHLYSTPAASLEQRPRHCEMKTNNEDVEFSPHDVSEHSDLSMFPRILTRQDFCMRG